LSFSTTARRLVKGIGSDDLKKSMIPGATKNYFFLRFGGNACNKKQGTSDGNMQVDAIVLHVPKKSDRVLATIHS